MVKRYYQDGGDVDLGDDEDFDSADEGGGPTSAIDPTQALLSVLTQNMTTTPEAQQEARGILQQYKESQSLDPTGKAFDAMNTQAEGIRAALRAARSRLLAQQYNPGDPLLAAGAALSAPARTVGESLSHMFEAVREPLQKRREFERQRSDALTKLDIAEAGAGAPEAAAELKLQMLRENIRKAMAVEALKTLGKPSTGAGNKKFESVIPDSAKALDRAYVKDDYLPFVAGGSSKAAQGLTALNFAKQHLESGKTNLTGPFIGTISTLPYIGRKLQNIAWPAGADVRDMIEQNVQESLRPILGAQFTEQEGERLIARVYNPQLSEKINGRRLGWLIDQLTRAYHNKVRMANYYQRWHTLFGYKGPTGYSVNDFIPPPSVDKGEDEDQTEGLSDAAKASLKPGAMLRLPGDPVLRARGGTVRLQRGGNPDLQLPEEEPTLELPEDQPDTAGQGGWGDLIQALEAMGMGSLVPAAIKGAAVGMPLEAMLSGIQRRIAGGTARRPIAAMERAGIDPVEAAADVTRGRRAGVPQQLMDVDAPGVQVLAEEALQHGGKDATQALEDLRDRVEGSRDRTKAQVNKGIKPYEYFPQEEKYVSNVSNEARQKLFQPVYDKYPALPVDPVIGEILGTPEGKKAIAYAMRFYENAPGSKPGKLDLQGMITNPSLEFYDRVRKGFDKSIAAEERAGEPTEFSGVLRDLRKTFVDRLDQMAPKDYKEARQQYGGDLEVRDALRAGRNFQKLQPEQIEQLVAGQNFHEKNAYRTGVAQSLYEMIDKSASVNPNVAQQIIGSPAMVERLRPLFDNSQQFKLFQTALEREAQLHRTGSGLVRRAESARLQGERTRLEPAEYVASKASGLRYAISPIGWLLRIFRDRPKMTEAEASRVLNLLQQGSPGEMEAFAKTAKKLDRLKSMRTAKRAGAAAISAAAAAMMGGGDEEE